MDAKGRHVEMKDGTFLRDKEDIHNFIPCAMSIAQLIIDMGLLVSKVANDKFCTSCQIYDFSNNEA